MKPTVYTDFSFELKSLRHRVVALQTTKSLTLKGYNNIWLIEKFRLLEN